MYKKVLISERLPEEGKSVITIDDKGNAIVYKRFGDTWSMPKFIREEEAILHTDGKLDEGTKPLEDKQIFMWFEEYEDNNPIPIIRRVSV